MMMDSYPVQIDPVKLVLAFMHTSDAIHSRYRRTELGMRLIPEYTSSIRFDTVMGDYS
jgi:hypothetical protein